MVFQAEDRESGKTVVLRRFFPYGPEGGGLQEAERSAYMAALDRVRDLRHPTLRTTLDGGCDPVDGMPFLVTEWVEGQRLAELLRSRPLSPGSTKALLSHALEASKELARAFGEEAVWVETAPESIVLPVEGEMITFWICPMKWLSSPEKRGGLLPLARLAEKALHWRGKPVAGTAEGLGSWVKAVRDNPNRWTLDEALQALHEPLTMTGPPTQPGGVPTIPMQAAKKTTTKSAQKKFSALPALLALLLMLAVAGGGFYVFKNFNVNGLTLTKKTAEEKLPQAASALEFGAQEPGKGGSAAVEAAPAPVPARPSALSSAPTAPAPMPPAAEPAPAKPAAPPAPAAVAKAPFTADPKNQLVGTVVNTMEAQSKEGTIRYMLLKQDQASRWVAHTVPTGNPGLEMSYFQSLMGKNIRVTGEFHEETGSRGTVLHVSERKQIEEQQP